MQHKKIIFILTFLLLSGTFLYGQCNPGDPDTDNDGICDALDTCSNSAYNIDCNNDGNCQTANVVISEILTNNYGSITNLYDEDGDSPDFIELFNTTNSTIDLSAWKLIDEDNIWKFPPGVTIAANGFLTIWASGKDKHTTELHTNFKLSQEGEYLGVYDDQNNLVFDFGAAYPKQYNRLSYGINTNGVFNYFDVVTKNATNTTGYLGKVATPTANFGRGFYNSIVNESLSCETLNATINYTLDGTPVTTSSSGFINTININPSNTGIARLRAKAYSPGYLPSDEVSFSYIFPESRFSGLAADGINSLPVISIQTDDQILPFCTGPSSDRMCDYNPTMIEWIEEDSLGNNLLGFSEYAGVTVYGESTTGKFKRNYRISFDALYNDKYLNFPLFENNDDLTFKPTNKFRKFELRGANVETFAWNSRYISGSWWDNTILESGELAQHSRFVNLFVNNEFRGIYTLKERYDHHFYESYTDVDVKHINAMKYRAYPPFEYSISNGVTTGWNNILNPGNYYDDVKHLIAPKSFISQTAMESLLQDYHEREFRIVGSDLYSNAPYRFIANDISDFAFSISRWGPSAPIDLSMPIFAKFTTNAEFRQEVYEFTAKVFCGNGALTLSACNDRLSRLINEITLAIYSEAQMFVDGNMGFMQTHSIWENQVNNVMRSSLDDLPNLHADWASQGLYNGCDLRPVVDTENQTSEINTTLSYVIDATDPDGDAMTFSVVSGLPAGLSINSSTGEISGTPTQLGTYNVQIKVEDTNNKWGYHYFTWEIIDLPLVPDGIIINEIMYHPDSLCLGLPADSDLLGYIELKNTSSQTINLSRSKFTDGLDFQFPQSANIPPGGFYVIAEDACAFEVAYGFTPNAVYKGGLSNDGERLELSDAYGNTIDSLTFNDKNPWDEDPDGKGPSLELLHPTLDNNAPLNWFRSDNPCGTPGAENSRICNSTAQQIVINEINYNSNNGVTDPGDWVELHNPTANAIDISDWTFYDNNNEFIFPSGTSIGAGEFLVLVENDIMFTTIFPHLDNTQYIGNFNFGLSNKGERVSLFDESKCLSDYVIYNDKIPWDTIPDGNGPTLSLITPNSDNALAQSWEASSNINSAYGTPGRANEPCPVPQIVIPDTIYSGIDTLLTVDIPDDNTDYTWVVIGGTSSNSNADSTTVHWNNPGTYNIQLITSYFDCTKVSFKQVVVLPGCVDIQLHTYLEGAYDPALGEMRNTLVSVRKLLPGQTPASNLTTPTPVGQPYGIAPWNYAGTEGTGWTDADYTGDETDWVLVSFRTGTAKNTEVGMTAAVLHKDGGIDFPNRCALTASVADSLYIIIEHRNHIGIMSPIAIPITNNQLFYDFRASDSYRDVTSFGQKQTSTGEWVMFAGDASQLDFPSFDINGTDKTIWFDNNGVFDYYLSPDFNLDGDINGQDKSLWFENNGISSRVPK